MKNQQMIYYKIRMKRSLITNNITKYNIGEPFLTVAYCTKINWKKNIYCFGSFSYRFKTQPVLEQITKWNDVLINMFRSWYPKGNCPWGIVEEVKREESIFD